MDAGRWGQVEQEVFDRSVAETDRFFQYYGEAALIAQLPNLIFGGRDGVFGDVRHMAERADGRTRGVVKETIFVSVHRLTGDCHDQRFVVTLSRVRRNSAAERGRVGH